VFHDVADAHAPAPPAHRIEAGCFDPPLLLFLITIHNQFSELPPAAILLSAIWAPARISDSFRIRSIAVGRSNGLPVITRIPLKITVTFRPSNGRNACHSLGRVAWHQRWARSPKVKPASAALDAGLSVSSVKPAVRSARAKSRMPCCCASGSISHPVLKFPEFLLGDQVCRVRGRFVRIRPPLTVPAVGSALRMLPQPLRSCRRTGSPRSHLFSVPSVLIWEAQEHRGRAIQVEEDRPASISKVPLERGRLPFFQ